MTKPACRGAWRLLIMALLLAGSHAATTQHSPQIPIHNADQTATDDLGRQLPTYAEVSAPKPNRWVGLFYWQWHSQLRAWSSYNNTEWLKTHPNFKD